MRPRITARQGAHTPLRIVGIIALGILGIAIAAKGPADLENLVLTTLMGNAAVGETSGLPPANIEPIAGTELNRVILSEQAAKRTDVQTALVAEQQIDGVKRLTVPFAAVLYDVHGGAWVYANPEPLTFVRAPIVIERIVGDTVVLSKGPDVGARVVTVGAAELSGAEKNIGSLGE